ncbi:TIGR02391 family protein [Roseisolibacter sp. H3M3-2]|uniref:TIGR02391 family protein n=1 Tax=Roseisolibacter sp. H3M3-2 TaxID=3031323 RepID=UPI0023DA3294|nr:TIGR02391 family protein [Roseisolibacter sp. H3M3-2]MDF1502374.1 TIGR02391 family protein [Roseisolibacter sp. H3M3-2]
MAANYRAVAVEVGDTLKFDITVNEVNRIAGAIFRFSREDFPNPAITSVRAQLVHDWILSLAKQRSDAEERDRLLTRFCLKIAPDGLRDSVQRILTDAGISGATVNQENVKAFAGRGFHPAVIKHSRKLFLEGNYFHAVFEAAKAYNVEVRQKAKSTKDGQALMLDVLGVEKGVLKLTAGVTDTDRNVQEGVKFLSAGLMQAIRNPTAHEPALDWPISREDALDILSFLSFLFRQIERAVYYKP